MSRNLLITGIIGIGISAFFVGLVTTGVLDPVLNPVIHSLFFSGNEQLSSFANIAKFNSELPLGGEVRDDEIVAYDESRRVLAPEENKTVRAWFAQRNIDLIGVNKEPKDMYENGFNPDTDTVDIQGIPGVWELYGALTLLPESHLELLRGKTIFVSSSIGRPYTVVKGDAGEVLQGVKPGFIQPQPITKDSVIRVVAHSLLFHEIEGLSEQQEVYFAELRDEYFRLFATGDKNYAPGDAPSGFVSAFATQSRIDNFAEHYRYYVLLADEFRRKASVDADIARKYIFFRDKMFAGMEY